MGLIVFFKRYFLLLLSLLFFVLNIIVFFIFISPLPFFSLSSPFPSPFFVLSSPSFQFENFFIKDELINNVELYDLSLYSVSSYEESEYFDSESEIVIEYDSLIDNLQSYDLDELPSDDLTLDPYSVQKYDYISHVGVNEYNFDYGFGQTHEFLSSIDSNLRLFKNTDFPKFYNTLFLSLNTVNNNYSVLISLLYINLVIFGFVLILFLLYRALSYFL